MEREARQYVQVGPERDEALHELLVPILRRDVDRLVAVLRVADVAVLLGQDGGRLRLVPAAARTSKSGRRQFRVRGDEMCGVEAVAIHVSYGVPINRRGKERGGG